MSPTAPLRAALLLAGLALSLEAGADPHPRLALYHQIRGNGFPYTTGGVVQGPFDNAVLDEVARYDELIFSLTPVAEYRPQLLDALRSRNPDMSILAYVIGSHCLDGVDGIDSTVHYPTRFRRLMRDMDGYLFNKAGARYHLNVNLAKRNILGRYALAEAIAELWVDVMRTGGWNGIFIDFYCDGILWTQTPTDSIDAQRAGYPSLAAFDVAWKAGTEAMAARLRQLGGPDFVLVGNCGQGTKYTTFNGWMRENFPFQNGGTWHSNMDRAPGGYFTDDARFLRPTHNYLFAAADTPAQPYAAASTREARFVLGTASLGDGFGVFAPGNLDVVQYLFHEWWYDEYGVDLATGRSSASAAHTGWLGEPVGTRHQLCWLGTGPDASTNPEFETDVTTGWSFRTLSGASATLTRDTGTAGSGAASARLDLPVQAGHEQHVELATAGTIPVTAGQRYSATFWARAQVPCTLTVAVGTPGVSRGEVRVPVGTTWQRQQVVITPFSSGNSGVLFFLGKAPRRVWLDDVHFQAGVTHVWRRDFENGIVVVNPWNTAMTFPLGRAYQRILGTADPVNDGSSVSTVTLGPSDAAFLIGDGTRPAPVVDLTPVGP